MKITPAIVAGTLPFVLLGGIATAAEAQHRRVTQACASNATGVLRAVPHCTKGEHRVELGAPVTTYRRVVGTLTTQSAGVNAVDVVCPAGSTVTGGGAGVAQSAEGPAWQPDDARLVSSSPVNDTTWQVSYYIPTAGIIQAWAICAQAS